MARKQTEFSPEIILSSKNIYWEDDIRMTQNNVVITTSVPKLIEFALKRNEFVLNCLIASSACWLVLLVVFAICILR